MSSPVINDNDPAYHLLSVDELFRHFEVDRQGLSGDVAEQRLDRFGRNELRVRKEVPEIFKFLGQFKNFFSLLLICSSSLGRVIL